MSAAHPSVWAEGASPSSFVGGGGTDPAVIGSSSVGPGISGRSNAGTGVFGGTSSGTGVVGLCIDGFASTSAYLAAPLTAVQAVGSVTGVFASSVTNMWVDLDKPVTQVNPGPSAVCGWCYAGAGLIGASLNGYGIVAKSTYGPGVYAIAGYHSIGVHGETDDGVGVEAISTGAGMGISAYSIPAGGIAGYFENFELEWKKGRRWPIVVYGIAGEFYGNVEINGWLTKSGSAFKIDHPLDPANKFLLHSCVESPEMKNVYDGVVKLDGRGKATVRLPNWFDAVNTDLRYQLTAIGAAAPDLHVSREVRGNAFEIAGGPPRTKVCWQITGVRQDAWARAHPLSVEQPKPKEQRGQYLHPELFDSRANSISRRRAPTERPKRGTAAATPVPREQLARQAKAAKATFSRLIEEASKHTSRRRAR